MATTTLFPINPDFKDAAISVLNSVLGNTATNIDYDVNTLDITSASTLTGANKLTAQRVREEFMLDKIVGGIGYSNLSFDITSNVLTTNSASGQDFSPARIGMVKFPSIDRVGEFFTATASSNAFNQTITNTDLNGVEFGTTTSRAHTDAFPLYIYAINQDDTNANVQLFISGYPNINAKTSPASTGTNYGEVGALPSGTGRDVFVALGAPGTPANWGGKPMVCIGIIKATKAATNIWSFSALDNDSGIGKFGQGIWWTQTAGHYGNKTSSYFDSNNAPSWAAEAITYTYDLSARVKVRVAFTGTCTNGSNTSPLGIGLVGVSTRAYRRYIDSLKTASVQRVGGAAIVAASAQLFTTAHTNGTSLLNNALSNSADTYVAEITYQT
jgi:hypothetical protein